MSAIATSGAAITLTRDLAIHGSGEPSDKLSTPQQHVAALQAGIHCEHHFQQLFERYYGPLLRFFTRRGFSQEERCDLAQETFLRLYRGIATFRQDGHFEGWLFQIAANVYRNAVRDRQAGKRKGWEDSIENYLEESAQTQQNDHPSFVDESTSGPLGTYLEKERLEILAEALQELPDQMRRCIVLRVHHELKYRDIASVMQISIETVKAHLYQARHRLKDTLAKYFDTFDRSSNDL